MSQSSSRHSNPGAAFGAAAAAELEALKPMESQVIGILLQNHVRFRDFLTRHLGDLRLAEDLLQQSMVKAMEQGHQIENAESAVAWFYRVLRNAATDHLRGAGADRRKLEGFLSLLETSGEDQVPAPDDVLADEVCACLNGLLETLKPEYAELIRRVDLVPEVENPDTLARELGITRGNFQVRLHRARQALKKSLELSCGTCAEHGCLNCTCAD